MEIRNSLGGPTQLLGSYSCVDHLLYWNHEWMYVFLTEAHFSHNCDDKKSIACTASRNKSSCLLALFIFTAGTVKYSLVHFTLEIWNTSFDRSSLSRFSRCSHGSCTCPAWLRNWSFRWLSRRCCQLPSFFKVDKKRMCDGYRTFVLVCAARLSGKIVIRLF